MEHSRDQQLARNARAGVLAAWHEFVVRYSGLIFSIVGRYLADFDDETRRNAYVEILQYMYSTGLGKYDGRAALSTWVMAISRSRSLDMRRSIRGRRREPTWLASLQPRDQEVFHSYFENGEDIATILHRFARKGERLTAEDVSESLDRLDSRMDHRLRSRLAYDLHARSVGAVSGSLLGLLDHLRIERAAAEEALRPDLQLMEEWTSRLLELVRQSVGSLAPEERKVVELHFYQHRTAPEIAAEMGLAGPRRAYTLINRAVGHLRRLLSAADPAAGVPAESEDGSNFPAEGIHD